VHTPPLVDVATPLMRRLPESRGTTNAGPIASCVSRSAVCEFYTLSVDDIISSVCQLPDKSSAADPIPTFVLKQTVAELFNRSPAAARFP